MALNVLLDTNAYGELKRGHPAVSSVVRRADGLLLSTVVVGELLYGFRRGTQLRRNLEELEELVARPYVEVVPVSRTTADRYGRIADALREKGTPIPTNDVWIAAHAMETGAELVSFDQHFARVDGLVWHLPEEPS